MKTGLTWSSRWILGGALALAVVALLALVLVPRLRGPEQVSTPSYWPTHGWRSSTPEEQGFDSAKLAEGLLAIRERNISIHSLMLIRNGSVFLDAYFYPYDGSTYHDLASVTKSVMTSLIGIAATQGKLNLDAPMVSFFPNRTIANRDARKERITVRHLASMSSGLDCTEADSERTLRQMWASRDWVQFALDRPVAWEPGTHWVYCSPGMHLLSAILQQATGMTTLEYARENLFKPLGIQDADWPADPQGYARGWGDLALHPQDAAKLGYLWLNQGNWDGQQIVSREWVTQSTIGHFSGTGRKEDYGYGWWVAPADESPNYFLAAGRGGQRIQVFAEGNLIIVTTGGGFEFDQVGPYLEAAIGDPTKPLPTNPAGVAELNAALAAIVRGPAPQPVAPLPTSAQAISGKTFVFAPNPGQLRSLRLDLNASAEATVQLDLANEASPRLMGVGLDGVYRPSRGGRPILARGQWTDASTFVLECDEGPGLNVYTLRMRFEGNRVSLEIPGQGSIEGRLQNP
ncbi:MAG TPA: serine hydrolase [Anaerolineae bacterium]|nr:serine hydrolase [Anaerolineae bacterium]